MWQFVKISLPIMLQAPIQCVLHISKILLLLRDTMWKTVPNPTILHPTAQYSHSTALLFTQIISNQFLDLPVDKSIHVFDVIR